MSAATFFVMAGITTCLVLGVLREVQPENRDSYDYALGIALPCTLGFILYAFATTQT